jgi:hypothetical protein
VGQQFLNDLSPYHIVAIPITDHWGTPFSVWTGAAVAGQFGIEAGDTSEASVF